MSELPFIAGPRDPDVGWRFLNALMNYEDWRERGAPPGDLDLETFPPEYGYVIEMWPDTFEYFRHAMREYMDRQWSDGGWFLVVRSLIDRARHEDPFGYQKLRDALRSEPERLSRQARNARRAQNRAYDTRNVLEWVEQMLEWHRKFFEIDSVLWLLGVLAEFARSGKVKPGMFGGPTTTVSQGALVNDVRERLSGTPLENLFERTYDTPLRNAITHNDYELIDDTDTVSLVDHGSGRTFSEGQLHEQIYEAMSLEQAMLFAHKYIDDVSDAFHAGHYRDHGLTDVSYIVADDGSLTMVLFQLWCFHEQDSAGNWLDSATVAFRRYGDMDHVTLSEHSCVAGSSVVKMFDESGRSLPEWARVIRVPVAPDLDLGYQKLHREAGHYEVLGPGDSHIVRVTEHEGHKDQPRKTCPHYQGGPLAGATHDGALRSSSS